MGEKSLCLSLLDISEFENVNDVINKLLKAFEKKKLHFNIQKRQIALKPYTPFSEDAKQYDMTPT